MLTRDTVKGRGQVEILEIEGLLLEKHPRGKIDAAIDSYINLFFQNFFLYSFGKT